MNQADTPLPGLWRFVWLFWMQPITLHRLLRSVGVDPSESTWKILRRTRSSQEDWWLTQSTHMMLILTLGTTVAVATIGVASGQPVDWLGVAGGVVVGLALGMAISGAPVGVVLGVIGGLTGWLVLGIIGRVARDVGFGIAGLLGLVALDMASVGSVGVARGVVPGETLTGLAAVVERFMAFVDGTFRIPILLIETILETAACHWGALTGQRTLHWAPALYHDLSYLPHPFLAGHILAEADADPALARRVLEACSMSSGQRRTGLKVEASLRARELKRLAEAKDFQAIHELRGVWLPGVVGADAVLLGFSETARYLTAAQAVFNPHHRLRHLKGFSEQAKGIDKQLRSRRDTFTEPFEESLRAIRAVALQMRASAEADAEGLILNPFRAGDPLSDAECPELFRGRETAVRDIEEILSDPSRRASLQLLAPRRAGKTSLLKMLPRLLPDTICVFFDLQAHPVASARAFWIKLAEQASIHARLDHAELPPLRGGPPMEAAAQWLEEIDQLPGGRRVLIAIDEFERLQDLFPGSRQEFLQLMGLFRATIQHRRGVRLLVSGVAPFDELDGVWDDHFISARQIKLPFLDRDASVGLLSEPSPEFPSGAIPVDVAEDVYRRTGGQPFLLQVFGSLLVSRLNDEKRKTATVDDVQAVEGRAIEWAETYFRDAYRSAPPAAREALGQLIRGQTADLTPVARRWLTQRYLLTTEERLAIPLFGAWIEHNALG